MKTVCDLNMCAGCMLCKNICPKDAIKIKDDYMHYNAIIDVKKCVSCSLCETNCPQNTSPSFVAPIWYKQGWSRDEKQRELSSSGGVAYELMRYFLNSGGTVCSCTFSNGLFVFEFASDLDELQKFTGSKYIKSNPNGVYKRIKQLIAKNKKILFIGLPCQTAAVINYVGNTDYLYTVDLICHGTPSPNVLFDYLKQKNVSLTHNSKLTFRKGQECRLFKDGKPIEGGTQDNYMTAFLKGLSYTANCYSCKYAQIERATDITIGDSWNSELSKEDKKKGISLILCQTQKGIELVENSNIDLFNVDIKKAVNANHQLEYPTIAPKQHEYFLNKVRAGKKIDTLMLKIFPKREVKNIVKRLFYFLHLR